MSKPTDYMHIDVAVAPINQRGRRRSMKSAIRVLNRLIEQGLIENLRQPKDPMKGSDWGKYIRVFDVPIEHLHRVEHVLQHHDIGYRKEPPS